VCPPPPPKKEEPAPPKAENELPELAKKAVESLNNDCGSDCHKAEKKKAMAKNAISAIEKAEDKEKEELKVKEKAAVKEEGSQGKDAPREDDSTATLAKKALDAAVPSNTAKSTCGGGNKKTGELKDLAKKALDVMVKKEAKPEKKAESACSDEKDKDYQGDDIAQMANSAIKNLDNDSAD